MQDGFWVQSSFNPTCSNPTLVYNVVSRFCPIHSAARGSLVMHGGKEWVLFSHQQWMCLALVSLWLWIICSEALIACCFLHFWLLREPTIPLLGERYQEIFMEAFFANLQRIHGHLCYGEFDKQQRSWICTGFHHQELFLFFLEWFWKVRCWVTGQDFIAT